MIQSNRILYKRSIFLEIFRSCFIHGTKTRVEIFIWKRLEIHSISRRKLKYDCRYTFAIIGISE